MSNSEWATKPEAYLSLVSDVRHRLCQEAHRSEFDHETLTESAVMLLDASAILLVLARQPELDTASEEYASAVRVCHNQLLEGLDDSC